MAYGEGDCVRSHPIGTANFPITTVYDAVIYLFLIIFFLHFVSFSLNFLIFIFVFIFCLCVAGYEMWVASLCSSAY